MTATFEQLAHAWRTCAQHKRNTAAARAFESHLERNLLTLHAELTQGTYTPGPSICFAITHPKPREVWAAQFRDRVVHHLLYNHIAPRFHAAFTADSCACIPGRGTLYGMCRLEHQVRSATANWQRPAHYLKLDLANFFVSIRKAVLLEQLARRVHEPWWLALASTILMHDPRPGVRIHGQAELLRLVPPHKSLFHAPAGHGLPIGNLSSQFFANVLLDELDQFIKHRLRAPHYVRYVDDMVLVHPSPQWLNEAHAAIEQFLPARLHLHLNPRKTILQPVDRGVDFVGQVLKPHSRTTRRRTVAHALRRIEQLPAPSVHATGNSYLGLLRQASSGRAQQTRIARALLKRGHVIDGDLSRAFRRAA